MKFLLVYSISLLGLFFLIFNTFLFHLNKKVANNVSIIFLWYLVMLSVVEISCHIVGLLYPNSNLFISHFYFIFQLIFLSCFYFNLFKEKIMRRLIILIFVLQMLILGWMYYSNFQLFYGFNTYEIVSISFLLVIYAAYFIYKNLVYEHKYFNFSIGLILYLLGSIAIFLFGNLELVLIDEPYVDIWVINSLFYIAFQYFILREYRFIKNIKN